MDNKNRLRELRKAEHMTQEELGKVIGKGRTTVNSYETGRIIMKTDVINKFCSYFNVSKDYLLCKSDLKNPLRKDENDVKVQIELLMNEIAHGDNIRFDGKTLNETQCAVLVQSLHNSLNMARSVANSSDKKGK